jgi:hypothetical protein
MAKIPTGCALTVALLFLISCASGPVKLKARRAEVLDTPEGKFIELPEGLKIDSVLQTPLSSRESKPGDRFNVRTAEPVELNGRIIIPAGTIVNGTVTSVTPPKDNLVKAGIGLSFDTISLGGVEYPFHSRGSVGKSAAAKGAKFGGKEAGKAAIGAVVPPAGVVFVAGDVYKGIKYLESSKEIELPVSARVSIRINGAAYIPLKE